MGLCKKHTDYKYCCNNDDVPIEEFTKSQWQKQPKSAVYLLYRWFIALFFTVVVIKSMIIDSENWTAFSLFFVYLTNWSLLACLLSSVLGVILVTAWYCNADIHKFSSLKRYYWYTHTISMSVAIVVTVLYFTFIFDETEKPISFTNLCTHILNSIFMVVDLLIVAHPLRFLHMFLPVSFGLVYVLFSLLYQKLGGLNKKGESYIYSVTDWNEPVSASFAVIGISIVTCCIHILLFILYKARISLFYCLCGRITKKSRIIDSDTSKVDLNDNRDNFLQENN